MSYIEDIAEPLIKTLTHAGGLPVHQLAGHAANLEFWVGEVKHAFDVIDGYYVRFKNIEQGEKDYVDRHDQKARTIVRGYGKTPPLKRGIKDQELRELRRRLSDAIYHVLGRCYSHELISEAALEQLGGTIGLDLREMKRRA